MKVESNKKYSTYVDESTYKKNKLQSLLKKTLFIFVLILASNFFVAKIFNYNLLEDIGKRVLRLAGIYTDSIPQVSFESDGWSSNTPGSWHVDKSAKWTGFGKAKVTFDLNSIIKTEENYKDIVLVLDISGSMAGDKLDRVKQDATELTEYVLNNPENKVALISFDSTSTILSYLSNSKKNIVEKISELSDTGCTNYNAALKNVLTVLEGYEHKANRDLVVLFLTDGYPNEETPNQIATSTILKEKYPYLTINGVQYEMGVEIQQDIIDISDNQFYADMETLNNVLFDASLNPETYENFEIVDYIEDEYFYVNDVNDIKVSEGTVKLEGSKGEKQKITWNLGNNFKTGKNATMEISLTLKEEYIYKGGLYPTNESESFKSKLPDEKEETKDSTLTPVLKNSYKVEYDVNLPKDVACNLEKYNKKVDHYVFENVNYAAEGENLTCDGYIFKGWEIDDKESDKRSKDIQKVNDEVFVMPEHDVVIRGTWSRPTITKSMEGIVNGSTNLYKLMEDEAKSGSGFVFEYTKGDANDSYTDPDANEKIYYYRGAVTNNNVIFGGICWLMVRTTATGGVKIIYNGSPDSSGGCNNTGTDQELSRVAFNYSSDSVAYVGYMYNPTAARDYVSKSKSMNTTITMLTSKYMYNSNNNYYSTSITYSDGQYHLGEDATEQKWSDFYSGAEGYYMCDNQETSCSKAYYISGAESYMSYTIELTNGELLEQADTGIYLGTNYTENSGTYTITDSVLVKKQDWYKNYNDYKDMYICGDGSVTSCSENDFKYLSSTTNYNAASVCPEIKFGNSFTYNNGEYTLTSADSYKNLSKDYARHHYTCWNTSGTCQEVSYIYEYNYNSMYSGESYTYINLKNGKSIENALEEMLSSDDVNQADSYVKSYIDRWYNVVLKKYESSLEDTIFCNDRSISSLAGWDPNRAPSSGSGMGMGLTFGIFNRSFSGGSLACKNETDRFSVSNPKARLKYPVGLLSGDEANLAGGSYLGGYSWWLGSPYNTIMINNYTHMGSSGSNNGGSRIDIGKGVRPVVSLKAGTWYSKGDGTKDNPYIIHTNTGE